MSSIHIGVEEKTVELARNAIIAIASVHAEFGYSTQSATRTGSAPGEFLSKLRS